MIKKINIEGKEVSIDSSSRWFFIYRKQFGNDILIDLMPVMNGILEAIAEMTVEEVNSLREINDAKSAVLNADAILDALQQLAGLEIVTVFEIFWAMAKNADDSIQEPMEFVGSFEKLPLDILIPEIGKELVTSCISSKKLESLREVFRTGTAQAST